jgi:hypothetical protein
MVSEGWSFCDGRLRVLIIEHSPVFAQKMSNELRRSHQVVGYVSTGEEALTRLSEMTVLTQQLPVDAIIVGDDLKGNITGRQMVELLDVIMIRKRLLGASTPGGVSRRSHTSLRT